MSYDLVRGARGQVSSRTCLRLTVLGWLQVVALRTFKSPMSIGIWAGNNRKKGKQLVAATWGYLWYDRYHLV